MCVCVRFYCVKMSCLNSYAYTNDACYEYDVIVLFFPRSFARLFAHLSQLCVICLCEIAGIKLCENLQQVWGLNECKEHDKYKIKSNIYWVPLVEANKKYI